MRLRARRCGGTFAMARARNGASQGVDMTLDRITVDANVCFGQPTIRGTRITVTIVLRMIASGMSAQHIVRDYPELSDEDVRQAAAYGAWLASEQTRSYSA